MPISPYKGTTKVITISLESHIKHISVSYNIQIPWSPHNLKTWKCLLSFQPLIIALTCCRNYPYSHIKSLLLGPHSPNDIQNFWSSSEFPLTLQWLRVDIFWKRTLNKPLFFLLNPNNIIFSNSVSISIYM